MSQFVSSYSSYIEEYGENQGNNNQNGYGYYNYNNENAQQNDNKDEEQNYSPFSCVRVKDVVSSYAYKYGYANYQQAQQANNNYNGYQYGGDYDFQDEDEQMQGGDGNQNYQNNYYRQNNWGEMYIGPSCSMGGSGVGNKLELGVFSDDECTKLISPEYVTAESLLGTANPFGSDGIFQPKLCIACNKNAAKQQAKQQNMYKYYYNGNNYEQEEDREEEDEILDICQDMIEAAGRCDRDGYDPGSSTKITTFDKFWQYVVDFVGTSTSSSNQNQAQAQNYVEEEGEDVEQGDNNEDEMDQMDEDAYNGWNGNYNYQGNNYNGNGGGDRRLRGLQNNNQQQVMTYANYYEYQNQMTCQFLDNLVFKPDRQPSYWYKITNYAASEYGLSEGDVIIIILVSIGLLIGLITFGIMTGFIVWSCGYFYQPTVDAVGEAASATAEAVECGYKQVEDGVKGSLKQADDFVKSSIKQAGEVVSSARNLLPFQRDDHTVGSSEDDSKPGSGTNLLGDDDQYYVAPLAASRSAAGTVPDPEPVVTFEYDTDAEMCTADRDRDEYDDDHDSIMAIRTMPTAVTLKHSPSGEIAPSADVDGDVSPSQSSPPPTAPEEDHQTEKQEDAQPDSETKLI